MIQEAYVSFETAKLLKEKGFDVPITSVWIDHLKLVGCSAAISIYPNKENWNGATDSLKDIYTSAPTLQMAMKWLEDDYYDIQIYEWSDSIWVFRYESTEMNLPHEQRTMSYLHQLQHAFHDCGIDKTIEL